jgi:hypothetical protein
MAVSALMFPGTGSRFGAALAQGTGGGVQMDQAEFTMYDTAVNKTPDPKAQAPLLEAYLAKYPQSAVKNDVLQRIMIDYSQFDHPKAVTAADAVLQVNPTNLQAYVLEVVYRKEAAEAQKDPAAKQAGLDDAASFAQKGIDATKAPKPADFTDAQYAQLVAYATPNFYSAIGEDDLAKKDGPGAIAAYKAELALVKPDQLTSPPVLQEVFFLGQAYYLSTPPDYLDCAFYATRAAALAPDQFKPVLQPTADYCYKKQHGTKDGYDALVAAAKASPTAPSQEELLKLMPPAPTDKDQADGIMKTTADADIPKLATGDKEYILQYASPEYSAKVWDAVKGKTVQFPDALVISATPTEIQVAVSDGAVQDKKADYTFKLKPLEAPAEPKARTPAALAAYRKEKAAYEAASTPPAVGSKVTLNGTYESYTPNPIMIIMSGGEIVPPAPAAKPSAARRPH